MSKFVKSHIMNPESQYNAAYDRVEQEMDDRHFTDGDLNLNGLKLIVDILREHMSGRVKVRFAIDGGTFPVHGHGIASGPGEGEVSLTFHVDDEQIMDWRISQLADKMLGGKNAHT